MHMMDAHRKYIQIAPKHGYIEKKKKAIDSDEWQPYKFYGRSKGLNYSKSLSPYHFGLAM